MSWKDWHQDVISVSYSKEFELYTVGNEWCIYIETEDNAAIFENDTKLRGRANLIDNDHISKESHKRLKCWHKYILHTHTHTHLPTHTSQKISSLIIKELIMCYFSRENIWVVLREDKHILIEV